jgi:hypothetical protein
MNCRSCGKDVAQSTTTGSERQHKCPHGSTCCGPPASCKECASAAALRRAVKCLLRVVTGEVTHVYRGPATVAEHNAARPDDCPACVVIVTVERLLVNP